MPRKNPYDTVLETIERSMHDSSDYLDRLSKGVRPFDSKRLKRDEEAFLYDHPHAAYEDLVLGESADEAGMLLTEEQLNAEARRRMLEEMGAAQYVRWVELIEHKRVQALLEEGD